MTVGVGPCPRCGFGCTRTTTRAMLGVPRTLCTSRSNTCYRCVRVRGLVCNSGAAAAAKKKSRNGRAETRARVRCQLPRRVVAAMFLVLTNRAEDGSHQAHGLEACVGGHPELAVQVHLRTMAASREDKSALVRNLQPSPPAECPATQISAVTWEVAAMKWTPIARKVKQACRRTQHM